EAERVPLKSPLDGDDLMALFGRGPGPWLRPIKDHLLELVIDGELAPDDHAGAEAEARRFAADLPPQPPSHRSGKGENGATSVDAPPVGGYVAGTTGVTPLDAGASHAAGQPFAPNATAAPNAEDIGNTPNTTEEASSAQRTARRKRDGAPAAPKHEARAATRHPSPEASLTLPAEQPTNMPLASTATPQIPPLPSGEGPGVGARDAIVAFLDGYLNVGRFRDVAPNGMQVVGKRDVRRVALGVSAHLALIEAAVAGAADMIIVHHGLFLDRDSHVIHERQKRRLKALFDHDITLLGYHLPLDAHPEIGNNVQWLRRLGYAIESLEFGQYHGQSIGAIGVAEGEAPTVEGLTARIAELAGASPRVYPFGSAQVRRLAVATGAAPGSLEEAVARGCDAYLTGETAEYTQAIAQEERATFIAAGHYNTERFGVQALGELLRDRFGVETFFVEVANDV
ncbi:MAG TPA: Nif3-like dinuclear metal center hexameric protein, partial [Ktedonobacterales bacterium]|nr:Nif3-like dinuclear metal center hexameric protein [Ktedonobacterales bacterium]